MAELKVGALVGSKGITLKQYLLFSGANNAIFPDLQAVLKVDGIPDNHRG